MYILKTHPFRPFVKDDTTHLVVGTFPTSLPRYPFYYSGEKNWFWKIMEKIYGVKFIYHEGERAKMEREEFLDKYNIGIMDMHEECYCKDGSSNDTDIYSVKLIDVLDILVRYDAINTIVFTSRTEAVGALGLFNIYLYLRDLKMVLTERLNDGLLKGEFVHNQKNYRIWVPYSPSQRSIISKSLGVSGLSKMYSKCFIK